MGSQTRTILLFAGLATCCLPSAAHAQPREATKVWEGTWSNRRYRTTGPLKCTATKKEGNMYVARFEGTFMGNPFEYTVSVTATPGDDRTLLESVSTIDGDRYEWTGYVRDGVFYGTYRSQRGHTGDFRLQETRN